MTTTGRRRNASIERISTSAPDAGAIRASAVHAQEDRRRQPLPIPYHRFDNAWNPIMTRPGTMRHLWRRRLQHCQYLQFPKSRSGDRQ